MKKFLFCFVCVLLAAAGQAYAAAPPFYPGEFTIWTEEQFPCNLYDGDASDVYLYEAMLQTGRRSVEIKQRNLIFEGRVTTCDSFVHAGILYVPVRQAAEFLGKEVTYFPDEKIILLEYRDDTAEKPQEILKPAVEKPPVTKEIVVDNIPIYYHSREAELDGFKSEGIADFSFSTFNCGGTLFMPLKTLTQAGGLVRVYKGDDIFLYDGGAFPQAEGINLKGMITGIDTESETGISEETVEKIAVKAASQLSEPGNVTFMATQSILYYGEPAVLLEIRRETGYRYSWMPGTELYGAYVYILY